MGNINSRSSSMTSFISIFSILMVILANHPTNSGAVPKSNKLQQQDALTELTERMQRSLAEPEQSHMKPAKRGKKLAKKQRSGRKNKAALNSDLATTWTWWRWGRGRIQTST